MTEIHYLCKIDKNLYSVITPDITTDEVIISEERIFHIKEHHPGDYEKYKQYMTRAITEPDYILEANLPSTAMILKEIEENGSKIKLILRLKTSTDAADLKNSVITFQKVNDKRYNRYLRNGKILYRKK